MTSSQLGKRGVIFKLQTKAKQTFSTFIKSGGAFQENEGFQGLPFPLVPLFLPFLHSIQPASPAWFENYP